MRISSAEFKLGKRGAEYPAVFGGIPEDGAIDYVGLLQIYEQLPHPAATLDTVLHDLESASLVESKAIGARMFYQRRKSWWSTKEVALALGVSERTVQAWAQEGRLPSDRGVGGHLRFRREDIEVLVGNRNTKGKPITSSEDPVLADLWNNEADAAYDNL